MGQWPHALPKPGVIGIVERRNSTQKIVQLVQRQRFPEEVSSLSSGLQVKGHTKLANLSPVLIEGTIRVGGRIRHASIPKNLALPPGLFVSEDLYQRKQWRQAQFLADCFWKRWMREYIPTLQQRHKWVREKGNLAIGDLVLVVDDNSPRGRWLLGRVFKTFSWPWSPRSRSRNQDKKWYPGQINLQAVLAWGSSLSIVTSKMTLNYVPRTLSFRTVYGLFIGVINPTNTSRLN